MELVLAQLLEMGVSVDEPREEDPTVQVDPLGVHPLQELDLVGVPHTDDGTVPNGHRFCNLVRFGERVDLPVDEDHVRSRGHTS